MRTVLDLSILIDIKRSKRLARLTARIRNGDVAVVSFSLKKLRGPAWKEWLDRHRPALEVRLNPGREREVYAALIRDHGSSTSNPRLAEDDLMAITIALVRGWPLAMSDKVAVNLARQLGVRCLSLEQFLDGPNEGIQPPLFD